MEENSRKISKNILKYSHFKFILILVALSLLIFFITPEFLSSKVSNSENKQTLKEDKKENLPIILTLDKEAYDKKLEEIANNPPDKIIYETITTKELDKNGKTITKTSKVPVSPQPVVSHLWPVKTVYPNAGALLPFNRIIAYYGNLYSKKMGVLGEYEETEMLRRLDVEVKKWETADPTTPVLPALHYIAVVARDHPTNDGKFRGRMPDSEIDKVLKIAEKINAIVFLDIQVGCSTLQQELPRLEKYFKIPNVHLGIDAEFSMKT